MFLYTLILFFVKCRKNKNRYLTLKNLQCNAKKNDVCLFVRCMSVYTDEAYPLIARPDIYIYIF